MPLVLDSNPKNIFDRVFKKLKRELRDIQRARLRRKILVTPAAPPVELAQYPYRIHMLVCRKDVEMAICSCKSLVRATGSAQPFIFHDDGSLRQVDFAALMTQFPGAKIISLEESNARAQSEFGTDSLLFKYRQKAVMLLKLIDVRLFAETEKVIIMDSDILFFKNPDALIDAAKDPSAPNAFNRDILSAYMTDLQTLERICGTTILPEINAGLSVVNVNSIDLNHVAIWLSQLNGLSVIIHRIEQSLMAMLSAVSAPGAQYLPAPYDVSYYKEVSTSVCKHYVGRIRFGFELEGLGYLLKKYF